MVKGYTSELRVCYYADQMLKKFWAMIIPVMIFFGAVSVFAAKCDRPHTKCRDRFKVVDVN
jgi:hypothetical protein